MSSISNNSKIPLKIDNELVALSKPLNDDELKEMTEYIKMNGFKNFVYIWDNMIVYHYQEYCICKKLKIDIRFEKLVFKTRNEVIDWICHLELLKETTFGERRKYLIGKRFWNAFSIANKNIDGSGITHKNKTINQNLLANKIGEDYSISFATVYKYSIYAKAIDTIASKDSTVMKRLFANNLKISHENILLISRLPREQINYLKDLLHDESKNKISYSDIRHELEWKQTCYKKKQSVSKPLMPIKQTPKFDPDAEIASLSLTIPSWIGSINRTHTRTNFNYTTPDGRHRLKEQLIFLRQTVDIVLDDIVEETKYGY